MSLRRRPTLALALLATLVPMGALAQTTAPVTPAGATAAAAPEATPTPVVIQVAPGPAAQERLQTALIEAAPGTTIELAAGRYELTDGLSLDVDDVTVRGAGMDATILSFKGQQAGGEGLLVTSDRVVLRDFAIEDTKGDAIKSKGSDTISFLNLRTEWTGGPLPTNGAYGLYPVESRNVLIDGCVAIGASDAGIYVGQSTNIIVRNSRAEYNVAGIEIENSVNADVYDNLATKNAGGILVFDLPDLPQVGGHSTRIFRNRSVDNSTPNFAPPGNIVGTVPTGTGLILMANRNVHVFDNEFGENQTVNVMVISYSSAFTDERYNPTPRDIVIRNNRLGRAGWAPQGELGGRLAAALGGTVPSLLWDGVTRYTVGGQERQETVRLVIRDNVGETSFVNLGMGAVPADPTAVPSPSMDLAAFATGEITEPSAVVLPQEGKI